MQPVAQHERQTPPRNTPRRWLQFNLRMMLAAVLLCAVLLVIAKQTGLLTQQLVWWGVIPEKTIVTPVHKFAGEKYFEYEIDLPDGVRLPKDVILAFKDPSLFSGVYVLEVDPESREVKRVTPFEEMQGALADITGDGIAELIVGVSLLSGLGTEDEQRLPEEGCWELFPCLSYMNAYGEYCDQEIEECYEFVGTTDEVYSLEDGVKKLFEFDTDPELALTFTTGYATTDGGVFSESTTFCSSWADLYGHGVPVCCRIVEKETASTRDGVTKRVHTRALVGYFAIDPATGKWGEVKCDIPVEGSLKGLLAKNADRQ